jgi:hypothetical protein
VRAAPLFELKSVKTDLPDSDRIFPAGPESDAINNKSCVPFGGHCFEPAVVVEAGLDGESQQDDQHYKAPVAPEDVGAIVEDLTVLKGREIDVGLQSRCSKPHMIAHQVIGYTNLSMILES